MRCMDYGHRQEGGIIPNMDISIGFMVFQYKSGDKINNNFFDYIKTCLIFFMIIRKNTPLYGGRGVPSPARKHANVFRSAFWEW